MRRTKSPSGKEMKIMMASYEKSRKYDLVLMLALLLLVLASVIVSGFVWDAARTLQPPESIILWVLLIGYLLLYWVFTSGGLRPTTRGSQRVVFNIRYVGYKQDLSNKISDNTDVKNFDVNDEELRKAVSEQMSRWWPMFAFELSWWLWIAFAVYAWFAAWDRVTGSGPGANQTIVTLNDPPFETDNLGNPEAIFIAVNALYLVVFVLMALWRESLLRCGTKGMCAGFPIMPPWITVFVAWSALLSALIISFGIWSISFGLAFVPLGIITAYFVFFHVATWARSLGNNMPYYNNERLQKLLQVAMSVYWTCQKQDAEEEPTMN
jgi:hypothetical protein